MPATIRFIPQSAQRFPFDVQQGCIRTSTCYHFRQAGIPAHTFVFPRTATLCVTFMERCVSRWELGEATPSVENMKILSDLYDVRLDYLLKDIDYSFEKEESTDQKIETKNSKGNIKERTLIVKIGVGIAIVFMTLLAFTWRDQVSDQKGLSMDEIQGRRIEIGVEERFSLDW